MECEIFSEDDVISCVVKIKLFAQNLGFDDVAQTMIMTAVSEISRNIAFYAEKGKLIVEKIKNENKIGIEIIADDNGPGIKDKKRAMQDHYSTHGTLGLGLSGSERLMDEFFFEEKQEQGTRIVMRKWI